MNEDSAALWDVAEALKSALRRQAGDEIILRVCREVLEIWVDAIEVGASACVPDCDD